MKTMQGVKWRFKPEERENMSKLLGSSNIRLECPTCSEAKLEHPISGQACLSSNNSLSFQKYTTKNIFVGSWNVGGVVPPDQLDMEEWLHTQYSPADIYVLGFQEIVPLNTENVLGFKNRKVSKKWNSLIGRALNKGTTLRPVEQEKAAELQKVYPLKGNSSYENDSPNPYNFKCIVSKQMVGIFATVWVRSDLDQDIQHPSVSYIGCGIMGCLGNKGSVSIRFYLHHTSLCFVCSHLTSGGKEGRQDCRNANAANILSRTSFPAGPLHNLPRKILDHDRVVWLGDLNYRIYMPDSTTTSLAKRKEWRILLENDQLKAELMEGHVFQGWHEGAIEFPPTYKYIPNSEDYFVCDQNQIGKKSRAPAWCDRILWFGEGLEQTGYNRGECRISDHRPVWAMFRAEIQI